MSTMGGTSHRTTWTHPFVCKEMQNTLQALQHLARMWNSRSVNYKSHVRVWTTWKHSDRNGKQLIHGEGQTIFCACVAAMSYAFTSVRQAVYPFLTIYPDIIKFTSLTSKNHSTRSK